MILKGTYLWPPLKVLGSLRNKLYTQNACHGSHA